MAEDVAELLIEIGTRFTLVPCVTSGSAPGVYVVLTRSGAIYVSDIADPDRAPAITRYPRIGPLLHDATPLPGVHAFSFNSATGVGTIVWWKDNPEHYDRPDLPYVGTSRATSTVLLVGRVRDGATASPAELVGLLRDVVDRVGIEITTANEARRTAHRPPLGADPSRE